MKHVTYIDIARRHGDHRAMNLLLTIENLAQIKDGVTSLNPEERFQKAFKALTAINFAEPTP